ncbi:hypothetical protein GCM10029963_37370 [Micromonospora andamanensis]
MTVTLRVATADDLLAVGRLHQRSRVAAYSSFLPPEALADPTPEAMGEYWAERWVWERADHVMTVAERDGVLAGFSYFGPDDAGDPATGLLNAIHLEPTERGRGVGRALMVDALAGMRAAAGAARSSGCCATTPTPATSTNAAAGTPPARRATTRSAPPPPPTPLHPPPLTRKSTVTVRAAASRVAKRRGMGLD